MKIVAAAIYYKGLTFTGGFLARHADIFRLMKAAGVPGPIVGEIQGFLTDKGTFADRVEAGSIAIAAGQLTVLPVPPNLYSEDLW